VETQTPQCQALGTTWRTCVSNVDCIDIQEAMNQDPGNPCETEGDAYFGTCS
jgi:hypothetical protein